MQAVRMGLKNVCNLFSVYMDRFTFLRTNTHRKSLYWNIKYLFVYVQFLVYMNHYISIVFFSSVLHTLCVSGSFELGILCYCCCDSHKNPCFLFLHGYTYGFLYFLGSIFFCNHPITSVANIQLQHVCVCVQSIRYLSVQFFLALNMTLARVYRNLMHIVFVVFSSCFS